MSKKPNILFLFSDQHRHNALGCAGHPLVQTPNLDWLAGQGLRFERTWTQCPVCMPCRATMITGRYTHELGFTYNLTSNPGDTVDDSPFKSDWPTIMKQLQAGGYETASIGKTHYHSRPGSSEAEERGEAFDTRQFGHFVKSFGWDYVMEEYDRYGHIHSHVKSPYTEHLEAQGLLKAHQEQIKGIYRLTPTHWRGETSVLSQEHELSSFIADHAMDWLESRDFEKPFYLHLGFVQPHVPLMDDPTWAAYYADADIELPDMTMPEATNDVWEKKVDMLKAHSQVQTMTDDFVREGIRHYFGAVSLMDQKIGEVIDTLDKLGELENTWIIYSADHGEMLGEHHLWAKHCFYEGAVQVPLIISPPDREGRGVCSDLTQLIDVVSTLADIGQVDPPEGARGQSLLPVLETGSGGYEYVFSTIQDWTGVRNEDYRFTLDMPTGTPCELYDLAKDPGERNNCVEDPEYQEIVAQLKEVVLNHRAG